MECLDQFDQFTTEVQCEEVYTEDLYGTIRPPDIEDGEIPDFFVA